MPSKPMKMCTKPGCPNLTKERYCPEHAKEDTRAADQRRGSAAQRGYGYRWQQYSKWFLRQPDNVFCKLQLPGCNNLAGCVDHIDPPNGPSDPRFWDKKNHQAACIHCNSVKGRRHKRGEGQPFEAKG